ncbi:MAG: translation initiation factor IF-2 [Actinomycetota bacterium]|nr:translation initiation factor IF-2 [Actinomycetota bacterium]
MAKIRVHQLAKELNMPSEKIIELLVKRGVKVKGTFDALDEATVEHVRKVVRREDEKAKARLEMKTAPAAAEKEPAKRVSRTVRPAAAPKPEIEPTEAVAPPQPDLPIVEIPEGATVKEFAEAAGKNPNELIKTLIKLGEMVTLNQIISPEAIDVLSDELGIQVDIISTGVEVEEEIIEDEALLEHRAPVVTVMGHVDHGKTSLLDAIRKTDVISGEAGGITQHIGAYQVVHEGKKLTFIDTPGHEAFTAMRARGASVTDIAVLVVAADDGVMPQTVEAIDHSKAANVPIVVAINKIDKPGANPEKIKQELTEYELVSEEWGGDTVFVEVSAKQKTNIDELLNMILLVAEMRELKANPNAPARGVAIEAHLDKGRGPVATVLVQRGTIRVGDAVVMGTAWGRTRGLLDDRGHKVKEAVPGSPVEIIGLSSVPSAGDSFKVLSDDKEARRIAEERAFKKRQVERIRTHVTLDDLFKQIKEGEIQELNLVIKGDTQGSIEALRESLEKLDQSEVKVVIIHKGVGAITETDVMLASASNAIIIGFNVRPDPKAKDMAEKEKVDLRVYRIIYKVIEDIKAASIGMLPPQYEEADIGRIEVRETFKVPKIGLIAGCYVTEGEVSRDSLVRLVRDGTIVYEGKVASLRRFKEEAKNVKSGFECGIGLEGFSDVKEGDVIEVYENVEVART